MSRKVNVPDYSYFENGKITSIIVGVKGVKKCHVDCLKETDHQIQLNNRYETEALDVSFELRKDRAFFDNTLEDPVDTLVAEEEVDEEEKPEPQKDPRRERVEKAYPLLTKDQIQLFELLCTGKSFKEIAKYFRTSEDAISKRKRLLINRLKTLVEKEII